VSRSAKPHHRNRVDASVSGGDRETPAADDEQVCRWRRLLLDETSGLRSLIEPLFAMELDETE
jgi:hypothetical protein